MFTAVAPVVASPIRRLEDLRNVAAEWLPAPAVTPAPAPGVEGG